MTIDEGLVVALGALRRDAALWDDLGVELARAASVADRLDLGPVQLSWPAEHVGLVAAYADCQRLVVRLLSEGAAGYAFLAAALRTAAEGYEHDDEASAAGFASRR